MSKTAKTAAGAPPGGASQGKSGKTKASQTKASQTRSSQTREPETSALGKAPQAGAGQGRAAQTKEAPNDASRRLAADAAETERDDAPAAGQAMHKSVGWALTVLARLHRVELGERLAALGLFPGQEQLLQALHDHGAMTMGALAELMRVRPPTASKAVARLTAQGLVERAGSAPGDGRLVRVRLTAEGHRRAATLATIWSTAEQRLLAGFDQRERKKLRKFLRRAADNFQDGAEDDAPANGSTAAADKRPV